jgi:hypothetical protein
MRAELVTLCLLHTDMDADDIMTLHECFYLLEQLEERWGKWGLWKCMRPDFFDSGICGQSTLMSLLYDSSLQFPSKWSTQQLPSNGKSSMRPSAWAELYEEENEASRSERWAPCQLGEEDMIITRNPKVRSADAYAYTAQYPPNL